MTLDELMNRAAQECIDTRESYLAMFTEGLNGYVCRNEASINESRALFKGTYLNCQVWIERRGVSAALRCVMARIGDVEELAGRDPSVAELLELLSRLPEDRTS